MMIGDSFFDDDAAAVCKKLLGKLICVMSAEGWRYARIIETEAYYIHEKASHASLGYTDKRRALFMPSGTIYMYHSRAGASFNISTKGDGNAVLIKSAIAHLDNAPEIIAVMQRDNPVINRAKGEKRVRRADNLCSGQALLCRALGLSIKDWDGRKFSPDFFYIKDIGYNPSKIINTARLGIAIGRDELLPLRFIDESYMKFCTKAVK